MSTSSSGETKKQQQQQREQSDHATASEHGHTGQGAASALAQLISEGEKHRRQSADPDEPAGSSHP